MFHIRTYVLADGRHVVAFRGELDGAAAAEVAKEVTCLRGGAVIVDLLRARLVDGGAPAAFAGVDATYVAERPLLDLLEPLAPRTERTLAAALA